MTDQSWNDCFETALTDAALGRPSGPTADRKLFRLVREGQNWPLRIIDDPDIYRSQLGSLLASFVERLRRLRCPTS